MAQLATAWAFWNLTRGHILFPESSHLYFKNIAMHDYEGKELHKSVDYALIGHVMNTVPTR